jgi:hypothetical protein
MRQLIKLIMLAMVSDLHGFEYESLFNRNTLVKACTTEPLTRKISDDIFLRRFTCAV